jgi:uncharacterized protein YjiS (DUF1127 family)
MILLPLNIVRLYQLLAYGRSPRPVLWQGSSADWPIAQDHWGGSSKTEGQEHAHRPVVRLLRLLGRWRERERHRRELATMAARDFGDIAAPPGLIREEQARWPWQAMSPGWAALSRDKCVPRNDDVCSVNHIAIDDPRLSIQGVDESQETALIPPLR